jgi:protein TonB
MFEQTFVDGTVKSRSPWTVMLSFLFQCLVIGVMILIPLIYTDSLPRATLTSLLVAPPPPPPPPPPSAGVVGVMGGVPGGAPGGVLGGIIGAVAAAAPPPPPPPVAKPVTPSRIRVGGNVQAANLVRKVTPVYPPLAKQARIQGTVRFTAIIGKDGTIQNLQLVSGHPLLVAAAQAAVTQWVYKPTLLNGEPVEVVTQIDVNFTLSQ